MTPPGIGLAGMGTFTPANLNGEFHMDREDLEVDYLARVRNAETVDIGVYGHTCPACGNYAFARRRSDGLGQLHCFGGCSPEHMLAAAGLTWRTLYPQDGRQRRNDDPDWWRDAPHNRHWPMDER